MFWWIWGLIENTVTKWGNYLSSETKLEFQWFCKPFICYLLFGDSSYHFIFITESRNRISCKSHRLVSTLVKYRSGNIFDTKRSLFRLLFYDCSPDMKMKTQIWGAVVLGGFFKTFVLRNFVKFAEKHLCQSLFF